MRVLSKELEDRMVERAQSKMRSPQGEKTQGGSGTTSFQCKAELWWAENTDWLLSQVKHHCLKERKRQLQLRVTSPPRLKVTSDNVLNPFHHKKN